MMLPLLHAAQATAGLPQLDRSVLALAAAAFVACTVVIWRPQPGALHRPAVRRRVLIVSAYAAITIAVLPSVLPLHHIVSPHVDTGGASQVHAAHCHESPGSCSDLPLASGPGQLLTSQPLLLAPTLTSVLILLATRAMRGRGDKPDTPPPLAVRALAT